MPSRRFVAALLAIVLLLRRRRLREEARIQRVRNWVNPLNSQRLASGQFHARLTQLRQCPESFRHYLRMSVSSYEQLLALVRDDLRRTDTAMRRAITPEERLVVTLRYLATGSSFASLHYEFLMGTSTIRGIVKDTCQILWERLCIHEIPSPSSETWGNVSDGFLRSNHFPNCVGALAGKHVRVRQPMSSASPLVNRPVHLALLAVADTSYRFVALELCMYEGDPSLLRRSMIGRSLAAGSLHIPPDKSLPGSQSAPLPHVFAAGKTFPLSSHILQPYTAESDLSIPQKIFNYRLSRARRPAQCAFSLLAKKWQIFLKPIPLAVDFAMTVVKAACVLHNYVLRREGCVLEDTLEDPIPDMPAQLSYDSSAVVDMRETYAAYFTSPEGELPLQYEGI
ncbi:uncharacterized protein [Dendropsophus ebraccatus]|uniref:uncharacterized protein n=1 Tax=Dendropsophus ebraccatus TaxID=150705 RepID=UPI0038323387